MHPIPRLTLPLFALMAQPLPAQELAPGGAGQLIPSADVLANMCSPQGAMQSAFGETGVPGSTRIETMLDIGFATPPALAPFRKAQPRSTEWSGRFMQMAYAVAIADKTEAQAIMDAIGTALADAGWAYVNMPPDEAPIYLLGVAGYATFEWPVETVDGPSRVLIGLDHMLGELVMTCARDDLLRAHAEEAFGRLPPGTPRPQVREIAVPHVIDEARCSDPALLAEMDAMLASREFSDGFISAMVERTRYRDRLTTWMLWKLDESGKISTQDLLEMSLSSIGDASPGGDPFAALAMLEEMFPILDEVAAAETARDPQALCRSLIPFHHWITRVDAITLKQTEAIQILLTREAARLGVPFD